MTRPNPTISAKVWRRGWRREAAATQAAAASVGRFIKWLEDRGFQESADIIRDVAMRDGVREAEADLQSTLNALCRRSRVCG